MAVLIGCTTPAPLSENPGAPSAAQTPSPVETPSPDQQEGTTEKRSPGTELPGNASVFLNEGLRRDVDPVIVGDAVAAGWFYPLDPERAGSQDDNSDADRSATTGSPTPGAPTTAPGALGLYATPQSLYVAHRSAAPPESSGGDTTHLSHLLPNGERLQVRGFEPVHLREGSTRANGFRLRFSIESRDEEIFVLWADHTENPLYIARLPISSVRRTALRDLTGDEVREMVYLSVVFNARGNREIIADALEWDSTKFVHAGSVALIQAINEQLSLLEERLRTETDTAWITAANGALQPIEESLPVEPLLPAVDVRVPRISELSLDLGQGEWEFSHDIAVEGNLYRLRIHLEANPLVQDPARIVGIQGR
ncbi:MAG: hypothetical protein R6U25_06925 [Alkalispirochaeta sp.]